MIRVGKLEDKQVEDSISQGIIGMPYQKRNTLKENGLSKKQTDKTQIEAAKRTSTYLPARDDMQLLQPAYRRQRTQKPKKRETSVKNTDKVSKTKVSQTRKANIKINQYIVEKTLGKGSFAKVKLVTDSSSGNKFAIKVMNKNALKNKKSGNNGKNAFDCVLEELEVLKRLQHPNIIYLHEIIDDKKKEEIYLVTEFHSRGSLGDLMREKNLKFEDSNRRMKEK